MALFSSLFWQGDNFWIKYRNQKENCRNVFCSLSKQMIWEGGKPKCSSKWWRISHIWLPLKTVCVTLLNSRQKLKLIIFSLHCCVCLPQPAKRRVFLKFFSCCSNTGISVSQHTCLPEWPGKPRGSCPLIPSCWLGRKINNAYLLVRPMHRGSSVI